MLWKTALLCWVFWVQTDKDPAQYTAISLQRTSLFPDPTSSPKCSQIPLLLRKSLVLSIARVSKCFSGLQALWNYLILTDNTRSSGHSLPGLNLWKLDLAGKGIVCWTMIICLKTVHLSIAQKLFVSRLQWANSQPHAPCPPVVFASCSLLESIFPGPPSCSTQCLPTTLPPSLKEKSFKMNFPSSPQLFIQQSPVAPVGFSFTLLFIPTCLLSLVALKIIYKLIILKFPFPASDLSLESYF